MSLTGILIDARQSGLSGEKDGIVARNYYGSSDSRNNNLLSAEDSPYLVDTKDLSKQQGWAIVEDTAWSVGGEGANLLANGAGTTVEGVKAGLDIKKTSEIADQLTNADFLVKDIDNRYSRSSKNRRAIDDVAVNSIGKRWDQLSVEEKKILVDPNRAPAGITIQAQLGGGFSSGYLLPTFGREFVK